jgi:hypothetical protein
MKKIIYGCLIALLAINFGCEKDEINTTEGNATSDTSQKVENDSNLNTKKDPSKGTAKVNGNQQYQINTIFLEPIPLETETLDIYYNMDVLEDQFNDYDDNPDITGPFNIFYRDHWGNYFTIYQITLSNGSCANNIEKWVVNKTEYIAFLNAPPATPTEGTNQSSVKPTPVPKPLDSDEPVIISLINPYPGCFN